MQEAMSGLTVFGAEWCNSCKTVKKMLDAEGVNYTYLDVDSPAAVALAKVGDVRGLPHAVHNGIVAFTSIPGCRNWLARNGSKRVEAPKAPPVFEAPIPGLVDILRGPVLAEGALRGNALDAAFFDDLEALEQVQQRVREEF